MRKVVVLIMMLEPQGHEHKINSRWYNEGSIPIYFIGDWETFTYQLCLNVNAASIIITTPLYHYMSYYIFTFVITMVKLPSELNV